MAPDESDDDKGAGDKTQFGSAPPPQLKRTPQTEDKAASTAAKAPDAAPSPERTQASGTPPPTPTPQVPQAPAGERASHAIAPPPQLATPQKPVAAPEPSRSPPPPPIQADAEEEGTVIITRSQSAAATLQRVQPPGHSEVIRLDRTSYLMGRSHKSDVLLHSSGASREHARLTFHDAAWHVEPLSGKTVIANGVEVHGEQRLTHKTRLQLGGDELLFFDATAAASSPESRPAEPTPTSRRVSMLVAAAVVVALGVAAWWLFANGSRLP